MRATGIFTGTTSSPCQLARQSHFRYAIRAGRNLPDKEFRSSLLLLHIQKRCGEEWTFLPLSACRHAVRTISFPTQVRVGIWHVVSEDSSKMEAKPQGLKPHRFAAMAARLKSCPSTKPRACARDLCSCWPFLLIICTQRIFTRSRLHVAWDTQTFQHIARFY